MDTSQNIDALAEAMAKAQGEIKNAVKDGANPFYGSKYPTLESVREACVGPLSKNGIAVFQSPSTDGAKVSVDTLFVHTSGQWVKGTMTAQAKDDSPQAIGSAVSYLRRYALQSFAGVAPDDDDGQAAQPANGDKRVAPVVTKPAPAVTEAWERFTEPRPGPDDDIVITEPDRPTPTGPVLRVQTAKIAKEGTNSKGPWTLFAVKFSDGREGTTFSKAMFLAAQKAAKEGYEVDATLKLSANGKFQLMAIEPVFQAPF